MASRLADLSRANLPFPAEGAPPKKEKKCIPRSIILPTSKYGNPINPIVGTSGKQLTIFPTNNWWLQSRRLIALDVTLRLIHSARQPSYRICGKLY